jgi:hypothetical protein
VRPFTAADNEAHGELWTPVVLTDDLVVEVRVPLAELGLLELELTRINQGYRGFGESQVEALSGSCNLDVVCPEGIPWELEIPSVGVISTGGSTFCTGFLVNNVRQDLTPFFMTANHCGIGSGNAASLVVYWNYENSTCRTPGSGASGGAGDGSLSQFNTGSFFRSASSTSDFTLVELDDDPDPSFDVSWAGWSATGADASSAVAIHHPQTQEKRISFENQATTTTSYLSNTVPGNGTHVRVIDWDLGTTEGGSSGSPLFDQNHRVIGQLHGGFASCSSQTSDWYGKFSVSWTGGGSNNNSLRPWLDPDNTGQLTTNTLTASCAEPSSLVYNGSGVNPLCLASVTEPAIGAPWQLSMDTTVVPGATFSVLRLYPQSSAGTFAPTGEVLVALGTEFLAVSNLPAGGGSTIHTIDIPNSTALVGRTFYVQGGVGAGAGITSLCNAVSGTVGCAP